MPRYFAFGSNLSSERLAGRIGPVQIDRVSVLRDFAHGFTKVGSDGTGKGSIRPARGEVVLGVLYLLTSRQLRLLALYEGGYHELRVLVARGADLLTGSPTTALSSPRGHLFAHTFAAVAPVPFIEPSTPYLAHYHRGMAEHSFPRWYRERIVRQSRNDAPLQRSIFASA